MHPAPYLERIRIVCRKVTVEDPPGEVGWRWVAQGLERDICAQASTLPDALASFRRLILAAFHFARDQNIEPFRGIKQAPIEWRQRFGSAVDLPEYEVHVTMSIEEEP